MPSVAGLSDLQQPPKGAVSSPDKPPTGVIEDMNPERGMVLTTRGKVVIGSVLLLGLGFLAYRATDRFFAKVPPQGGAK